MRIETEINKIEKLDRQYLWHPFTQMKDWMEAPPVIINEGRGVFLKDMNGKWYIDGVSSLWVTVHGHRKKGIDDAVSEQLGRISHSTLLGLTHPPAAVLAEMLVMLVRRSFRDAGSGAPSLQRVFFSDNGSTAVEIALKMAFQYWRHRGNKRKKLFLSLNNAYHGDTIGAVSVGGIELFHSLFAPLLFKTLRAPSPYCYRCELGRKFPSCRLACLRAMEKVIRTRHQEIAAVIIEPVVQGAAGMIVAPEGYLRGVRELCTRYNIMMIADEVATGFGRTGKMFACEHEKVVPDILCLAKGITGGYLPLAATIASEDIYNAFLGEFGELKTFFHGHTYTGNELACAAAIANIGLFHKEKTMKKLERKTAWLSSALKEIRDHEHVGDVRQKGLMVGIELVRDRRSGEPYAVEEKMGWKVCSAARRKGVLIRPLGNVVVLMPPLSITIQELKSLVRSTAEAIREVVV